MKNSLTILKRNPIPEERDSRGRAASQPKNKFVKVGQNIERKSWKESKRAAVRQDSRPAGTSFHSTTLDIALGAQPLLRPGISHSAGEERRETPRAWRWITNLSITSTVLAAAATLHPSLDACLPSSGIDVIHIGPRVWHETDFYRFYGTLWLFFFLFEMVGVTMGLICFWRVEI